MEYFNVIASGLILAFFVLTLYMYREANSNRTIVRQLSFPDLPADFDRWTIFFISDIHKRVVAEKIIQNVKGKADIVVIGGDLAEKGVRLEQVKANLTKLNQIAPIYFVWGNNDYELDQSELRALLLEMNVTILENDACIFQSTKGQSLALIGVDYFSTDGQGLMQALKKAKDASFKILVSHDPQVTHSLPLGENVQLTLSGHTHGGQIRIFGYGPYEKGGIKKIGNSLLLVSNGYGTTAVPLRLGAKAETHLITCRRSLPVDRNE